MLHLIQRLEQLADFILAAGRNGVAQIAAGDAAGETGGRSGLARNASGQRITERAGGEDGDQQAADDDQDGAPVIAFGGELGVLGQFLFVRDQRISTMSASGSDVRTVSSSAPGTSATAWQPRGCTITGTNGNDDFTGTGGNDVICGFGGNDMITGLGGNDTILAGPGADTVTGGDGRDIIVGWSGSDSLSGSAGADRITGGNDPDTLNGGAGNDYLFGWDYAGGDILNGNAGTDDCPYDSPDTFNC